MMKWTLLISAYSFVGFILGFCTLAIPGIEEWIGSCATTFTVYFALVCLAVSIVSNLIILFYIFSELFSSRILLKERLHNGTPDRKDG